MGGKGSGHKPDAQRRRQAAELRARGLTLPRSRNSFRATALFRSSSLAA
jgi:hypothetical protein